MSKIEWTETTWNPVTGCSKVSPGCQHCYAERMAFRLHAMGTAKYANGFKTTIHEDALLVPLSWRKPRLIFVNSMSDLFHPDVPTEFILRAIEVMRKADWHQFQVLTKRSERLAEIDSLITWPDNLWLGVSVESEKYLHRIDDLRNTNAAVRFLSLEPLLGPLGRMDLEGIHWAIVGGESGPGSRDMHAEWVTEIRDQCVLECVPFFFKQWGGVNKKRTGRLLDGRTWDEMPRTLLHA
jgi:protein gp37